MFNNGIVPNIHQNLPLIHKTERGFGVQTNAGFMNIETAEILAKMYMQAHGLIEKGWIFKFDNSKNRFGSCYENYITGDRYISLSRKIVELNSELEVINTILHEIAHALVGNRQHHNHVWVRKAIEIGCDGKRCFNTDNNEIETPPAKYIGICPNGHIIKAHKKPKNIKSCGKCCNKFNINYIITYKDNL